MSVSAAARHYSEHGYAILPQFLGAADVARLRAEAERLVQEVDLSCVDNKIARTENQSNRNAYFRDSGDKIRYFYEPDALDSEGNLVVPRAVAFRKIAHGIHLENSVFRDITFTKKIRDVMRDVCGMKDPACVQSQYIFKQPKHGENIMPHMDATYLQTDPIENLIGLWIAIDDATTENGCLSFIPGSHKQTEIPTRFQRSKKPGQIFEFLGERPEHWFNEELYTPAEVKSGDLILIHGLVVHQSGRNHSPKPRHAYTFHLMERAGGTKWVEGNWMQLEGGRQFQGYENVPA